MTNFFIFQVGAHTLHKRCNNDKTEVKCSQIGYRQTMNVFLE